jgi:hypothetical protein
MRAWLVVMLAAAPALAQRAPDVRGEVLAESVSGAAIGLALPVTSMMMGCGALALAQNNVELTVCGACGVAGGVLTAGPAGSCGAAVGAWRAGKRARAPVDSIVAASLPGVIIGSTSTVVIVLLSTAASGFGPAVTLPFFVVATLAALVAGPITVCGATWAAPSTPIAELPPPKQKPRKRRAPPPTRPSPHPDAPDDGWTPPEPPPPPLLPQMGY